MFKRFVDYLNNDKVDIQERVFGLSAVIALLGIIMAFIGGLVVGEDKVALILILVSFISYVLVICLGYKLNAVKITMMIVSAMIIFIFMPLAFFTSGGVHGGTPVWCLFCVVYVGMILRGKPRAFFFISGIVVISVCWYVGYFYPESYLKHTTDAVYSDSIGSIFIVAVILLTLIVFQSNMFLRENNRSEMQKHEIKELNDIQNRFFSSMSHEIRTPINTILGLNEMILRDDISDDIREDAVNIQSAGNMLLHLINDILDMSKIQSGQMQLTPVVYSVSDMVNELIGMFQKRAEKNRLAFTVDVAKNVPENLVGDEVRIKQILINILNNAIKYTIQGSITFTIACEERRDGKKNIIYSVRDTGVGIKKENIPYLFDSFKRLEEEKNKYIEGTGLGLSVVKQLVDLMEGKITVNSIYTRGTIFMVELPQQAAGDRTVGEMNALEYRNSKNMNTYKRKFEAPEAKILVVDDSEMNILVVEKLLRDTKVSITSVSSGEDALDKTLDNEYDVIFMDHLMPGMDGIECFKRIRNQTGGLCRNSKVVVLTANAGSENQSLYVKEGFDGYLVKPVSGEALENELMRLLPDEILNIEDDFLERNDELHSYTVEKKNKTMIRITSESVAGIPWSFDRRYGISTIPYRVVTDNGVFGDNVEVDARGVVTYMNAGAGEIYSKAPSIKEYETFFAENLDEAFNVVHIALSSGVNKSGCEAAMEAAKSFDNVMVFDTSNFSGGHGLFVLEACRLAELGKTPSEIMAELNRLKTYVRSSFIADNMNYLAGANQISKTTAEITNAFRMRPVIMGKKGKMKLKRVYIGTKRWSRRRYVKGALSDPKRIDPKILIVGYSNLTSEEQEEIRGYIEERVEFENIFFHRSSAAIVANSGPNSIGLFYFTKREEG